MISFYKENKESEEGRKLLQDKFHLALIHYLKLYTDNEEKERQLRIQQEEEKKSERQAAREANKQKNEISDDMLF